MTYIHFQQTLKKKSVFSLAEVRVFFPNFDQRRLAEWKQKGYILQIIRGWYCFADKKNEISSFAVATTINQPSYISCESALSYYNLIPEGVFTCTAVTTNKSVLYTTPLGIFRYHKISPHLLFGYVLGREGSNVYKIATKEKAVLDFLYLKTQYSDAEDFLGLRIDPDAFFDGFDEEKRHTYLAQFGQKKLSQRANCLLTTLRLHA